MSFPGKNLFRLLSDLLIEGKFVQYLDLYILTLLLPPACFLAIGLFQQTNI